MGRMERKESNSLVLICESNSLNDPAMSLSVAVVSADPIPNADHCKKTRGGRTMKHARTKELVGWGTPMGDAMR